MMKKINLRTAISCVCFCAAAPALAYFPNTQNNTHHYYSVLSATFLTPSNSNFIEPIAGDEGVFKRINAQEKLGGEALFGFFLTPKDDLSVNYMSNYFNNTGSSSSNYSGDNDSIPVTANARYAINYNSFIFSLGHYINAGRWDIHLFGGFDYTHIINTSTINQTFIPTAKPKHSYHVITFDGIGPQMGGEISFRFTDLINVVGGANIGVLSSSIKSNKSSSTSNNVALKTQAKIGLAYEKIFKQNYPIAFEAGYRGMLIQNQESSQATIYSFSTHGPYLSVGLSF